MSFHKMILRNKNSWFTQWILPMPSVETVITLLQQIFFKARYVFKSIREPEDGLT